MRTLLLTLSLVCASTVLIACSSGSDDGQITPPLLRNWVAGEYFSSANYRHYCADPRTGNDPFTGQPVRDDQGRTVDENNWLRSIHNELYLWYDEIPDIYDPANFTTPAFFDLQITTLPSDTGSSRPKDNFHSFVNTQEFFNTIVEGVDAGYGAEFRIISASPPREVVVAYVEPGSPATDNLLSRGARIISVDGELVEDGDPDILNAGLFPTDVDESHTFVVRDLGAASDRPIDMMSTEVTSTPVQNAGVIPGSANVGYLLFNDHIATSETQLIDAINILLGTGVTDLVLDLRYNGGGFLDIASELAYMIGGAATEDLTFERLQFNDQYSNFTTNPITGEPLQTPFHSTVQGFSENLTPGDDLPTLNAQNVVVITSGATCSASEAIINGLRAVPDLNIFQVGTTTCGKPYGSVPLGNCGNTYLFTQFEGFNNDDQGGFSDGFKPSNLSGFGETITGCAVADDFDNDFDENEANIAVALDILADPENFDPVTDCPTPPAMSTKLGAQPTQQSEQAKISTQENDVTGELKNPNDLNLKIVF